MTEVQRALARVRVLLDLKRYDQAISLLSPLVAAEPADSQVWCLLATAQLGKGAYREAATAAGRAVALAPSDDRAYRLASLAQLRLGNVSAALTAAREACKAAPDSWRAHLSRALAELATPGHADEAEQAATTARRLAPNEPDAHFISGRVSYAQENWKAARAHHERALALNPAHSGALNELGRIRLRGGDHAAAARHFIRAVQSEPGVTVYGQNVEVAVRRLVARTIYGASTASIALMSLTLVTLLSGAWVLTGFALLAVLSVGFGAIQLWRMPRQARPLLRARRIVLALSVVYGSILTAVAAAGVAPPASLTTAVVAATALIVASRFVAFAILRGARTRPSVREAARPG